VAVTRHSDAVAPVRSSGAIATWLTRHVSTSIGSLGRLFRQPFSSLMIILVIAVTLAIPASLNLVVKNAQFISSGWDNALDFSIYLQKDLSERGASGLARLIQQRADVESVQLVTATDALEEFKLQSGFGEALDHLAENPLPHTLVVRPSPANTSQSMILLQEELGNLPEADLVQVDTEWVQRFHAHRQHDSAGYPESARGNRSHQVDRRQQCLCSQAVPLVRLLVWPLRGPAGAGARAIRALFARTAGRPARRAVSERYFDTVAGFPGRPVNIGCWRSAWPCWILVCGGTPHAAH